VPGSGPSGIASAAQLNERTTSTVFIVMDADWLLTRRRAGKPEKT